MKHEYLKFKYNFKILIVLILINFIVFDAHSNEIFSSDVGKKFLDNLKENKQNFLIKLSREEDDCLKLFLSGPCLEKLIIKHDTKIREFELQKQRIIRSVRRHEAGLRKKRRQINIEMHKKKVK